MATVTDPGVLGLNGSHQAGGVRAGVPTYSVQLQPLRDICGAAPLCLQLDDIRVNQLTLQSERMGTGEGGLVGSVALCHLAPPTSPLHDPYLGNRHLYEGP